MRRYLQRHIFNRAFTLCCFYRLLTVAVKHVVVKEEEEGFFFLIMSLPVSAKWQCAILVPKSPLASYGLRVLAKKMREWLKNVATFCFELLELQIQTPLPSPCCSRCQNSFNQST